MPTVAMGEFVAVGVFFCQFLQELFNRGRN